MNNQLAFTGVYYIGCERVGKGVVESQQLLRPQQKKEEVCL